MNRDDIPPEILNTLESYDGPLRHYTFKDGKIKRANMLEWMEWFSVFENRIVDRTEIGPDVFVSTIFLGIDHNFSGSLSADSDNPWYTGALDDDHKPILFESMVMGGEFSDMGWRYASWGEAKNGHWIIVDCIRAGRRPEVPYGERPWLELFLEMFDGRSNGDGRGDGDDPTEPDPGQPEKMG